MLVLTRNPGESLLIGADIKITVVEVRSEEVRLEISIHQTVPVNREQVWRPNVPIPISNDIAAVIVEIRGSKVRLGITAPRDVYVVREEAQQVLP